MLSDERQSMFRSMDIEPIQLLFLLFFTSIIIGDHIDVKKQRIVLRSLFMQSRHPSVKYALEQIVSSPMDIELEFNTTQDMIPCDVGTSVKFFFDTINQTTSLSVFMTDACQNVLSYIAEVATHLHLPVFSCTDSDLSLSSVDRYPYLYHIVPSDRAHNLIRKQLLQYFNWTRLGLIYQHGSKYTLVANDFSDLTAMDKKHWEVNLTRGIAYRHGLEWHDENNKHIKTLLNDFKMRDVRIIIANFNQTMATQMFCHAARQEIYGSRYQWIILGYPSVKPWWNERTDCSIQEIIRAINGTLQTRVPRLSVDDRNDQPDHVIDYLKEFSELDKNYFDGYAYDTIWSLAYIYQSKWFYNQSNIRKIIDNIDFIGATGRVRYLDGGRIGEILVEQYVACRMMFDGSCRIPCYKEEQDCNLTIVRVFLAKHMDSKHDPPVLRQLNPIMWHGNHPTRDRTNQIIQFEHIYLSVFISISICSGIGLIISIVLFVFNLHFRAHRYIRMSSPSLNNIILCGCMLAYISIIVMGVNSSLFPRRMFSERIMNIICPTRTWLLCISFTLAFGGMFSKTWRVHSIFTNIQLTKRAIHDSHLLAVVGILLCIDLLYVIAWQIFDPIHRKFVHNVPYRPEYDQDIKIHPYYEVCQGKSTAIWSLILVLYKGLLMFYGSFLSWTTRLVTIPALNDSRYIGLSVYIVFICCSLGSLIAFIPSEQIQLSYFLNSFFILICTTTTLGLVFVPKIVEVYRDPHSRKRQPRIIGRLSNNNRNSRLMSLTYKHFNNAILDNQQLNLILSMQEQTLEQLMEQLKTYLTKTSNIQGDESFEFERLVASDDEIEGDNSVTDDEQSTNYHIIPIDSQPNKGRLGRTISLGLHNRLHVSDLHWSDTTYRASISQLEDYRHSPSMIYLKPSGTEESYEQTTSSNDIQSNYNGLIALDDIRLAKMLETDLISSNC